jgi:hypothetical protein
MLWGIAHQVGGGTINGQFAQELSTQGRHPQ